jgi:hypothetical protein
MAPIFTEERYKEANDADRPPLPWKPPLLVVANHLQPMGLIVGLVGIFCGFDGEILRIFFGFEGESGDSLEFGEFLF